MCQFIMLTNLLRWIFEFSLLIEITYTFKPFKHDLVFYYKTQNNVFLKNPNNNSTSYGIYVAGETIYVDIPSRVAKIANMIDWKVINVNKDRLMFVHNSKPRILINLKTFKAMKFVGKLSDSIIALGDNEALHVPTILNPSLTKPSRSWNYIELLYFDSKNEKVSVIRRLPWSKHDDWKFIKEWKMTDYIHFDNKLYLLIKRTIWNDKASNDTQEISIIRLCLEKGDELISSAIEIHFTRPELQTNQIFDLVFVLIPTTEMKYELHSVQKITHNHTIRYYNYTINDFVSLFDETEKDCASGADNVTSLYHHFRSESRRCEVIAHEDCSTKSNIVPSSAVSSMLIKIAFYDLEPSEKPRFKFKSLTIPYPHCYFLLILHATPGNSSRSCSLIESNPICSPFTSIKYDSSQANLHFNKHPLWLLFTTKEVKVSSSLRIQSTCFNLKTCTDCIMYGLYSNCIWLYSICKSSYKPRNATLLTVNYCFKIINISPLIFDSYSPTTLTIRLDSPLKVKSPQESLVIKAGSHNSCTNITINGSYIDCSLNLLQSGKFKIELNLMNDNYADTAIIKAISTDLVDISLLDIPHEKSGSYLILVVLFSTLLIIPFLLVIRFKSNPQLLKEFVESNEVKKIIKLGKSFRRLNSGASQSKPSPKVISKDPK